MFTNTAQHVLSRGCPAKPDDTIMFYRACFVTIWCSSSQPAQRRPIKSISEVGS